MKETHLDARDQEILEAVVQAHIETGEPVGSRTVSRMNREGLSAATIRNVMADLEERRLLIQPHASAGRVPTDLGYRVYVDSLVRAPRLSAADQRAIESTLQDSPSEVAGLLGGVSRVLARLSRQMGVVVSPHIERVRIRDVEFVKLGPRRVLVILVSAEGTIHNKVVAIEVDHDQDKLDTIGRYLTEEFRGHTLPEIRDRLLDLMGQEKAQYDQMLRDAISLGEASTRIEPSPSAAGEVFVEGAANLLAEPDFTSIERLKSLFRTFEEKHDLVRVLNSCLEPGTAGVKVIIGSENPDPRLSGCSLIACSYGAQDQTLGALGIIGPTRIEYARAIALVDSVARMLSGALGRYRG